MTNLLWPGDQRAGDLMTDAALVAAMVAVESAWLAALAAADIAPRECASAQLARLVGPPDAEQLAVGAEDGGNPAIGLVALLRERAGGDVGRWLHRGLTSQDVVDTALMMTVRAVVESLKAALAEQLSTLCELAAEHRDTAMVARTLTQHAAPTTFGAKVAGWLDGVANAYQQLSDLTIPIQIGGAAGTLSAPTELANLAGCPGNPADAVRWLVEVTAITLELAPRRPWHTTRTPVTAIADGLVGCTDAWGRIASDVVTLARPEIGELAEPPGAGRGQSSTLPDKHNPVLSILIRRAAIAAPPLAATLHTAAALAGDERPDGAWHAEWDTLRTLARRTVIAGAQCSDLLAGLVVDAAQMTLNLAGANAFAEQRAIAELSGKSPSATYFGAVGPLIDQSLQRARRLLDDGETGD